MRRITWMMQNVEIYLPPEKHQTLLPARNSVLRSLVGFKGLMRTGRSKTSQSQ